MSLKQTYPFKKKKKREIMTLDPKKKKKKPNRMRIAHVMSLVIL